MIEVNLSFDFYRDINEDAYAAWAKKAIVPLLKSEGIIEFKAHRNLFGSPQVRLISTWKSLSNWATFAESKEWAEILEDFATNFATNISIDAWGVSPIAPEPLRPSK